VVFLEIVVVVVVVTMVVMLIVGWHWFRARLFFPLHSTASRMALSWW
jgi:hypothetical protein